MDHNIKQSPTQRFRSLIQRWNRRGIVEIGPENPKLFKLTRDIRTGLRLLLDTDEFTEELGLLLEKTFKSNDDKVCSIQALQPKTFQELRREHHLTNQDFLGSIAPSDPFLGYLQFLSSSKSGQLFVFCNDKRYIIKTEKKKDAKYFMKILPRYVAHLKLHPHSLIVRYMGFYCIHQHRAKPIYFSVMKNVFFPDSRIVERYDLKGCWANRYVKLSSKVNTIGLVLKDQNFHNQTLNLGPQKNWFDRQISIDTDFMQTVGVIDYSLLLGKQPLLQSDRVLDEKLADVVTRLQKSIQKRNANQVRRDCNVALHQGSEKNISEKVKGSVNYMTPNTGTIKESVDNDVMTNTVEHELMSSGLMVPGTVEESVDNGVVSNTVENEQMSSGLQVPETVEGSVINGMMKDTMPQVESSRSLQFTGTVHESDTTTPTNQNEPMRSYNLDDNQHINIRLLANLENSLHILDGVDDRYFLGIIDFFTTYGPKKKLEHAVKSFLHPFSSFSAVSVYQYADRFKAYLACKSV